MEDRLTDVIAATMAKDVIERPSSGALLDLIAYRTFDKSDIKAVKAFQAAILERLNIKLIVVGGGYGCTRITVTPGEIVIKPDKNSPEILQKVILALIESEVFREEALKAGFTVVIAHDPYTRIDLRTGQFERFEQTLLLFCSYTHEDEEHKSALDKHLSTLKRLGLIRMWHDREITAGNNWEKEIDTNIMKADVVLLLVSADFLASDYCYGVELKAALTRHNNGKARVIPIIVRAVDWTSTPIEKLQALPKDAFPITSWSNRDEAWTDVTKGIRKAVEEIIESRRSEDLPLGRAVPPQKKMKASRQ